MGNAAKTQVRESTTHLCGDGGAFLDLAVLTLRIAFGGLAPGGGTAVGAAVTLGNAAKALVRHVAAHLDGNGGAFLNLAVATLHIALGGFASGDIGAVGAVALADAPKALVLESPAHLDGDGAAGVELGAAAGDGGHGCRDGLGGQESQRELADGGVRGLHLGGFWRFFLCV